MGRINQLTPTTTLTANSVIAMDAASGGATNKVTIQTLAAGLRSFGNYATQAQLAAKQDVLTFDDAPEEDSDNPVTSGGIYNAIGSAMSNVYTKAETDNAIAQSTAMDTLYHGQFYTPDATIQLSHPVTDYNFVLLDFKTNAEHTWQLIPTASLPIGSHAIHATIVGNNTSGQVTYPPSYNSSINVQFVTASTIKCTLSMYNNSNFRISLSGVYGLSKK